MWCPGPRSHHYIPLFLIRSRRCVSASDGDCSANLTVRPPDRHPRLLCVLPTDPVRLVRPPDRPSARPTERPSDRRARLPVTHVHPTNQLRPPDRPSARPTVPPPSHTSIRSFGRLAVRPFVGPSVRPTDRPSARSARPTVTVLSVSWSARPSRTSDPPTVRPIVETTGRPLSDRPTPSSVRASVCLSDRPRPADPIDRPTSVQTSRTSERLPVQLLHPPIVCCPSVLVSDRPSARLSVSPTDRPTASHTVNSTKTPLVDIRTRSSCLSTRQFQVMPVPVSLCFGLLVPSSPLWNPQGCENASQKGLARETGPPPFSILSSSFTWSSLKVPARSRFQRDLRESHRVVYCDNAQA